MWSWVCSSRDAGTAVGKLTVKELRAAEACKKQKSLPIMLANVDLKNNSRSYRKPFWILWVREELQWICFKSIFIYHKITYDSVMKRHLRPRFPPFKGRREIILSFHRSPASPKLPTHDAVPPFPPFKEQGPVPPSCTPVPASLCSRTNKTVLLQSAWFSRGNKSSVVLT